MIGTSVTIVTMMNLSAGSCVQRGAGAGRGTSWEEEQAAAAAVREQSSSSSSRSSEAPQQQRRRRHQCHHQHQLLQCCPGPLTVSQAARSLLPVNPVTVSEAVIRCFGLSDGKQRGAQVPEAGGGAWLPGITIMVRPSKPSLSNSCLTGWSLYCHLDVCGVSPAR